MKTTIEFEHGIGDRVLIKAIDTVGRVESMSKDINGLQYRVVYWNDGSRHSVWMNDWEVMSKPEPDSKTK